MIKESPVNIECHVTEIKELGSHHMFIADVTAVHADKKYQGPPLCAAYITLGDSHAPFPYDDIKT